jgi:hypothetical protein
LGLAAAALAIAAWALAGPGPGAEPSGAAGSPVTAALSKQGDLRMKNQRDGEPILIASNLAPGDPQERGVRITNTGARAAFSVQKRNLRGTPGPNGGSIVDVLRLRVLRVRPGTGGGDLAYGGRLSEMPKLQLGTWKHQHHRRYRFKVKLPDRGVPPSPVTGDNLFQGSTARVKFVWKAAQP